MMSTSYWLRDKERISCNEQELRGDYHELEMFQWILTIAKWIIKISYSYFVQNVLWCKFYTLNYKDYYFEKTIQEIKRIKVIELYFDMIQSNNYRNELLLHINIKYKYQAGDIVQIQNLCGRPKQFFMLVNSPTLATDKQIKNSWHNELF
eukprot:464081_1